MLYNFSFTLSMVGENGWTESLSQRKIKKEARASFRELSDADIWWLAETSLQSTFNNSALLPFTRLAPPGQCAPGTHACVLFWWPIMDLYMLNFCWYSDRMKSWREMYHSGSVLLHILPETEESASFSFPMENIFINGLAAPWLRPFVIWNKPLER